MTRGGNLERIGKTDEPILSVQRNSTIPVIPEFFYLGYGFLFITLSNYSSYRAVVLCKYKRVIKL